MVFHDRRTLRLAAGQDGFYHSRRERMGSREGQPFAVVWHLHPSRI
jgi:hypothetical protein